MEKKYTSLTAWFALLVSVPTTSAKPLCPKNCSSCQDGNCLVCDSGFALVSRRKNNSVCIPCGSGRNGKKVDKSQCDSGSISTVVVVVVLLLLLLWFSVS